MFSAKQFREKAAEYVALGKNTEAPKERKLFDNAGAMGDLLETKALRANIARFLHKHKDDER